MQDIHALGCGGIGGGGGGRIFTASGIERRLQPQNHQQALKCPRCDSQNTKFCYYNNYNLSQPRHYCKNCRRYWTKGGVLRNVPVGGGCRKSKRFSKIKSSKIAVDDDDENKKEVSEKNSDSNMNNILDLSQNNSHSSEKNSDSNVNNIIDLSQNNSPSSENNNSHSSSESSSLTTTTSTVATKSNTDGVGGATTQAAVVTGSGSSHANNDCCGHDDHCQPLIEQHKGPSNGHMLPIANMVSSAEPENIGGGGVEDGLFGEDEAYWNQAQWVDDNDQAFKFLPQFQVLDFNLEKK